MNKLPTRFAERERGVGCGVRAQGAGLFSTCPCDELLTLAPLYAKHGEVGYGFVVVDEVGDHVFSRSE